MSAWTLHAGGEAPALHWAGRWLSYAELDARADRLAAALADRGVEAGDAVCILAENHIAHVDLICACQRLGAGYAPLNYRLSAAEQRKIVETIGPALVLADAAHAPLLADAADPILLLDDPHADVLPAPHAGQSDPRRAQPDSDAPHMLLLTGGSTGTPKAAIIPRRQVAANARNTIEGWGLTADDCTIQATPAFHAAINVLTTPLLAVGGRVVWQPRFDPAAYLAAIAEHRVTLLFLVPTMYRMLAEHPDFARTDFSSVRFAISGGAPCPPAIRDAFAGVGVAFRQGYGLTEAGVNCFAINDDEAAAHPDAVGRPLPDTKAVIRDAAGHPVGVGDVGELTLAGEHVFAGYLNQPTATADTLHDGWLWTGDLARVDRDGLYRIVGRRKDLFISGGENVYPAEVEQAIRMHPDVHDCAVFGIPDARWGEAGVAAISPPGLTRDALKAHLAGQLAGYKIPRHVIGLDALPTTGAGKIDKPALKTLAQQQIHEETSTHAAANA